MIFAKKKEKEEAIRMKNEAEETNNAIMIHDAEETNNAITTPVEVSKSSPINTNEAKCVAPDDGN